jgi:GT2 family glycosyltransferase
MAAHRRAGVSVVIPVRGRVRLLAALLTGLAEARARCPEPTEVIVVDDSDPADADRHRAACRRHDAAYLRGPRRVGAKRNLGARAARFDLIAFVDSDCEADPDFLQHAAKALREAPRDVGAVAGPVDMIGTETATLRLFRRTQEMHQPFAWPRAYDRITWAATANLTVRAEAFEAVGGFAEDTLTIVGGEDVDLGVRMTKAGHATACAPGAVVYHSRQTGDSLLSIARRLFTYGRAAHWLNVRHPERREPRLNPVSALAAVGAVAAAAAPATRGRSLWAVPAAAAALLAQHAHRRRVPGDGATAVPGLVASTVLDWAFDAGEFVGAWQVGRPHYLFSRFGFMDDRTFVPRAAAAGTGEAA